MTSECATTVAQSSHPCAPAQDRWHWPAGMVGFPAKHTTEVNQTSQSATVSIWAAVCVCWEKRDPTCLVATCTLAVAGRARRRDEIWQQGDTAENGNDQPDEEVRGRVLGQRQLPSSQWPAGMRLGTVGLWRLAWLRLGRIVSLSCGR